MIKRIIIFCCCALLAALALVGASRAAPDSFELPWWTVDGGGGASLGGDYALSYTLGQPDAGTLSGGSYSLVGGFGGSGAPATLSEHIYLPLVMNE